MNCFTAVAQALENTYLQISIPASQRDAAVTESIKSLSDNLRNMGYQSASSPDYSDAITRLAYLFVYVPSFSHWVYKTMALARPISAVFEKEHVNITCLGGGPGSDVIGILKYLTKKNINPALCIHIVDKCIHWKKTWQSVRNVITDGRNINTNYIIQDALDSNTWEDDTFKDGNIFILNYFISELLKYKNDVAVKSYLDFCFSGTDEPYIVINDNQHSLYIDFMDSYFDSKKFDLILREEFPYGRPNDDYEEDRQILQQFIDKFKRYPATKLNQTCRVFKKKKNANIS